MPQREPHAEALLPEPDLTGTRIEILPEVFVEVETARSIQALLFALIALVLLFALDRFGPFPFRHLLVARPVLPALAGELAVRAPASPAPAAELAHLTGFLAARRRALEVLQYAVATLPDELEIAQLRLSSDAARPFDPAGFRLRLACPSEDPEAMKTYLENLRAILPRAALAPILPGAPELVIDSDPTAEPPPIALTAVPPSGDFQGSPVGPAGKLVPVPLMKPEPAR